MSTNLAAVLILLTNAPQTNYVTPSGKEIEVGRLVVEQQVTSYTNLNAVPSVITVTNLKTNALILERFTLKEEWVPSPIPHIQRPSPLMPHR